MILVSRPDDLSDAVLGIWEISARPPRQSGKKGLVASLLF